jgi:aerobic carbon-monoxide dehydrogenase small subunit
MTTKTPVTLNINGRNHAISVEPRRTLADAIREDCGQTGTHLGCEHGICGACTVIVNGEPVRSCLMFAVQAGSKKIRTVEGLAKGDELHPMQRAFMDHHGLQCGFCTPGFLMLAVGVLEREPEICSTCSRPTCAAAPATRTSSRRCAPRPPRCAAANEPRGRQVHRPLGHSA